MMIKKFTQLLIIIIVFNTSLVAMYDEDEVASTTIDVPSAVMPDADEATPTIIDVPSAVMRDDNEEEVDCITKGWRTMFSIHDPSIEEKTTKQGYYGFGGAFCMLGAHIYQNSPLAGVLTMVFGGVLYYQGWNTPPKDQFE
jgi:hypothetical protein